MSQISLILKLAKLFFCLWSVMAGGVTGHLFQYESACWFSCTIVNTLKTVARFPLQGQGKYKIWRKACTCVLNYTYFTTNQQHGMTWQPEKHLCWMWTHLRSQEHLWDVWPCSSVLWTKALPHRKQSPPALFTGTFLHALFLLCSASYCISKLRLFTCWLRIWMVLHIMSLAFHCSWLNWLNIWIRIFLLCTLPTWFPQTHQWKEMCPWICKCSSSVYMKNNYRSI